MPPAERWQANGFLPRMPDSLEQLDLLLIQVAKARQVRADGIHFQNLRYISTTLAAYLGEPVTSGLTRGTWRRCASSMKASSCARPSAPSLPVTPFHSEKFSVLETEDDGNSVASCGTVKPLWIHCSISSAEKSLEAINVRAEARTLPVCECLRNSRFDAARASEIYSARNASTGLTSAARREGR
jgi:hypothetical protein